jgi:hypothetical protein
MVCGFARWTGTHSHTSGTLILPPSIARQRVKLKDYWHQKANFWEFPMRLDTIIKTFTDSGLTQTQAEQVFKLYKKLRVLKYNAHDGYSLSHGAFFDKAVILKAAQQTEK